MEFVKNRSADRNRAISDGKSFSIKSVVFFFEEDVFDVGWAKYLCFSEKEPFFHVASGSCGHLVQVILSILMHTVV